MTTVTQTDKGNRILDIANDDHGTAFVDGVALPGCIRCCPAEGWADIMLFSQDDGIPLMNKAGDAVFVVHIVAENMWFKATESIQDQPETMSHG